MANPATWERIPEETFQPPNGSKVRADRSYRHRDLGIRAHIVVEDGAIVTLYHEDESSREYGIPGVYWPLPYWPISIVLDLQDWADLRDLQAEQPRLV